MTLLKVTFRTRITVAEITIVATTLARITTSVDMKIRCSMLPPNHFVRGCGRNDKAFMYVETPLWHAMPRCHQAQGGTLLLSNLASGCTLGNRSAAHPNGRFRPMVGHIVCRGSMAWSLFILMLFGWGLPHSSSRLSFASRSVANVSHVLARSDHIFLASGLFAVCAIRTQSSAC